MSQNPPPPPSDPYGEQPQQPAYDQPAYGQQPGQPYPPQQPQGGSGLAITALVFGILALLLCWTVFGGIILGLIALVVGLIAASKAKKGTAKGRGMAITGIVLGVLGLLISIGFIVVAAVFLNSDTGQSLQDCINSASSQSEQQQCQDDFQNDLTN